MNSEACNVAHLKSFTAAIGREPAPSGPKLGAMCAQIGSMQLLLEPAAQGSPASGAVTAWVAAVQKLLSSSVSPQSKASGVVLLGTTIQYCCTRRLLASFLEWGLSLMETLKRDSNTDVQGACCGALCQLFYRLHPLVEVQGVRRDGSGLASKAASTALTLLNSPDSPNRAAALELIKSVLLALPASCRHQVPQLESGLAAALFGGPPKTESEGGGSAGTRAQLGGGPPPASLKYRMAAGSTLALLPRVVGDAESWSKLARRLLSSAHDCMEVLFLGLDDAGLATRCRAALTASSDVMAKDAFIPALATDASAALSGAPPPRQLGPYLDVLLSLITAIEQMMVGSYPVPVPVPSLAVVSLAMRMLSADVAAALAAVSESGKSLPPTRGKALPPSQCLLLELHALMPAVHRVAWSLVGLVFRCCPARCTLVPLHGTVTKLLSDHLRRMKARGMAALAASGPRERQALYSAAADVIKASGVGVARPLAPEVLGAAMVEMYGQAPPSAPGTRGSGTDPAKGGTGRKKIKMNSTAAAQGGLDAVSAASAVVAAAGLASEGGSNAELATQASALHMMATVVETTGSMLAADVRARYDAAAAHLALTCSAAAEKVSREPAAAAAVHAVALSRLGLTSYQLLLSTVLAPCPHRPPFLSQALQLFRKGCSSSCPSVSAWSVSALATCESMLHPRALPIAKVQQYIGMAEVEPLIRPRMWSALDPAPPAPQAILAAAPEAPLNQDTGMPAHLPTASMPPAILPAQPSSSARPAFGTAPPAQQPPARNQQVNGSETTPLEEGKKRKKRGRSSAAAPAEDQEQGSRAKPAAPAQDKQPAPKGVGATGTAAGAGTVGSTLPPPGSVNPGSSKAAVEVVAPAGGGVAAQPYMEDDSEDSEGPLPDIDCGEESD